MNKKRIKQGKCAVCNQIVMIDEIGNGDVCSNCGWKQDAAANELHDFVGTSNPVSLNKARRLYSEGKTLAPDFEDFIDFCEMYGEVEFKYNNKTYGIAKADNGGFVLWVCNVPVQERFPINFANIEEFIANARIEGILVKDLWDKIRNFDCLN